MRFTKYFHFLPILFVFLTGCQVSALVVANHKLGESSTLANQDESEENDKNWILQFLDKEIGRASLQIHSIGDTIEMDGFSLQLQHVQPVQIEQLEPNHDHFIRIALNITNYSYHPLVFSKFNHFFLFADHTPQDLAITAPDERLNIAVPAGDSVSTEITYDSISAGTFYSVFYENESKPVGVWRFPLEEIVSNQNHDEKRAE